MILLPLRLLFVRIRLFVANIFIGIMKKCCAFRLDFSAGTHENEERKREQKKTVPTPTSIVYKNRCLPLFDSKTNCPLVNFHCECTFLVFGCFRFLVFRLFILRFVIVAASVRDALHTFTNLLLFGIFCLLLLLHIAVVACNRECMQVVARV